MNRANLTATLALIAHDSRKDDLLVFAERHREMLREYRLIATSTTGERLANVLGFDVERKLSGPRGGDAQIASEVAAGNVRAVVFLIDPLVAQPHEADIQSLLRLCNVHNVAVATNLSSARLMLQGLATRFPSRPLQSEPSHGRPSHSSPARSGPSHSRPSHSRPSHSRPRQSRPTPSHPLSSS